ncbi:MAG: branched-chain amino acid ABC transporter substrate-binding protein [Desulfobulbus propionicus]|nr:MAG: branched-chain amino acid ABC transporter substrate-binding protein [Desulfobulbus propionicus]
MHRIKAGLFAGLLLLAAGEACVYAAPTLKIGFNGAMTGLLENIGKTAKKGAELAREDIDKKGGVTIGGTTYQVKFLYGDNTSDHTRATEVSLSLIGQEHVIGLIGPQASNNAVPAGGIADAYQTPMISPWSTAPATTKNRPYVFRVGALNDVQASLLAGFIAKQLKKTKLAILYDVISAYPRDMAKAVRKSFEVLQGAGSVVAFEEFRTGDTDFRPQLERILQAGAEVIVTPQTDTQVAEIVRQARELGFNNLIMGSDSWAGGDLMKACGDDCKGLMFTGNYASGGAKGANKVFVDRYLAAYGEQPNEVAALTYDAVHSMVQALENISTLTGNIVEDRRLLKDQLVALKDFQGVTGTLSYNASGDPDKCVMVIEIDSNGIFTTKEMACP